MEYAVRVKNISKKYKLYDSNVQRLKEALLPFSKRKYYKEFDALRDISFDIRKGDIVGIIGTNGSGKSTILKIISGVLSQTSGDVEVNGRISALLELGAGFNMEYTGIENIRINGMMLGLSSNEIEERIPAILEFAEIGDFAYQPVKTYSSGMFARIAFATSINVHPDILIVDEALSVGDMYFQEKCYEKMKTMVSSGATIIFVSHSLPAIRNFCNKVVWIEQGEMRSEGKAESICQEYKMYLESKQRNNLDSRDKREDEIKESFDSKEKNKIIIAGVSLNKKCYYMDEDMSICIQLKYKVTDVHFGVGIIIRDETNKIVTLFNTIRDDIVIRQTVNNVELAIPKHDFVEGKYNVSVNLCDEMAMYPYDIMDDAVQFEVLPVTNIKGIPIAEGYFRQKHEWRI